MVVRSIIANIADGSTLYGESKRLNDEGVPSPGRRYKSGERKPGLTWSRTTVKDICHQSAYSGVHRVKAGNSEAGETIERAVPPIVEPGLRERSVAALAANKRRASPMRKNARRYLLSGLVRCGVCGFACGGGTTTEKGGDGYRYYRCYRKGDRGPVEQHHPHGAPNVSAPWLEDLVWTDVRRFVENPGEVLERVREQLKGGEADDLNVRHEDLAKRLAAKSAEKDRYVRLYAQGHLDEAELETYLLDLKHQTDNLRMLVTATEADLLETQERAALADTTHAWLAALNERLGEVEEDTPEAFLKRQQLVRLLVQGITITKGEDRRMSAEITYHFGPPVQPEVAQDVFGDVRNTSPNLPSR